MMTPGLRKLALTAHVTSSVGWLGAAGAYLAIAIAGLTSPDPQMVRSAYLILDLIGWFVIVPCSLATLLTGLVQSLATDWGLFRHYWIVTKLVLTVGGTAILLMHMRTVSHVSALAGQSTFVGADLGAERIQLIVHAGGGLLMLLMATTLSVYKPWGRTAYGQRAGAGVATINRRGPTLLVAGLGLFLLLAILLHLSGHGPRGH